MGEVLTLKLGVPLKLLIYNIKEVRLLLRTSSTETHAAQSELYFLYDNLACDW